MRKLVEEEQQAGAHAVRWDGVDASGRLVAAGVYFVELRSGRMAQTRKVSFGR